MHRRFSSARSAFTLVELLVVLAIIAMLGGLLAPSLGRSIEKADAIACAKNMRQIGVAVQLYANDNNHRYPKVETNPSSPVYPDDEEAEGILEALGDYGVSVATIKCRSDMKSFKAYDQYGSSYEWRPIVDEELYNAPTVYRRGGAMTVSPARVRLLTDFYGVHNGRKNWLFADGRVNAVK